MMHVALPPGKHAEVAILNIFEKGTGPAITFPATGFSATTAQIDGRERSFADYVEDRPRHPPAPRRRLLRREDQRELPGRRQVEGRGPVLRSGVRRGPLPPRPACRRLRARLHLGAPTGLTERIALSCNCILNFVNSSLEGRTTGEIVGPTTFGEIAYQLLNQTMVYLTVSDRD